MIRDSHPRAPSDVHLIVLGMLPRAGGRRVLDAAAGDGSVSRRMTEMGFQVISADLHFAHPPEVPSPIEIDLNETLPFPDEHFDAIVSIETIEHLENPWRFMRELARVCRVGGFVIVSSPNVQNAESRLRMALMGRLAWFGPSVVSPLGHITPIFDFLLDKMADRAGLIKDQVRFSRTRVPMTGLHVPIHTSFLGECRISRFRRVGAMPSKRITQ